MADLVTYLLQQTVVGLTVHPAGAQELSSKTTPLPPPMYDGNEAGTSKAVCAMGKELTPLVQPSSAWTMVAAPPGAKYPTYGYETTTPSSPLTLVVDTTTPDGRGAGISLVYVKAQSGYGTMDVTCSNGCTCDKLSIDCSVTYDQVVDFIETLRPTPAPACHVVIELSPSSPAGSKLRVSGVAVNGDPGGVSGRIGEEKFMSWLAGDAVWSKK